MSKIRDGQLTDRALVSLQSYFSVDDTRCPIGSGRLSKMRHGLKRSSGIWTLVIRAWSDGAHCRCQGSAPFGAYTDCSVLFTGQGQAEVVCGLKVIPSVTLAVGAQSIEEGLKA